jgi:hypothetical protein
VLLSVVYRLVRCLFGLVAVLVRSDLAPAENLIHAGWSRLAWPVMAR